MLSKKIFLASSAELKEDREQFEIFIGRKNKAWHNKGIFLELNIWEDFIDAVSQTRLQDEYDKVIKESDIFLMLFFTKVGKYTQEEFETAFGKFKETKKPIIYTYFKNAEIKTGSINKEIVTLLNFQEKLKELGHFVTVYKNIEDLKFQFSEQLDKLVNKGLIEVSIPEYLSNENIVIDLIEKRSKKWTFKIISELCAHELVISSSLRFLDIFFDNKLIKRLEGLLDYNQTITLNKITKEIKILTIKIKFGKLFGNISKISFKLNNESTFKYNYE